MILIQRDTRKKQGSTQKEEAGTGHLVGAPRHCGACRDMDGKTKAQLELNPAKVERNKGSFFKYILQ